MQKLSGKRNNLLLLALLFAGIAVFFQWKARGPRVTVCGLSLNDNRSQVCSHMDGNDYRVFGRNMEEQSWYKMDSPNVSVTYTEDDQIWKLEGGPPEIDGLNVENASFQELMELLGPPSGGGDGREVGGKGHSFLSYPEHRLLIQRENGKNSFHLFLGRDT